MANLPWVPMHMIKILKFELWCVCDICEQKICKSDKECCQSTNFIPQYSMTMMVRGPQGEFTLISKDMSVLRTLLYMERDEEWKHWLTTFRLMRMFSFGTSALDVFEGGPASDRDLAMKQCLTAVLRQYGQRPHFFDMKFRLFRSFPQPQKRYYCMLVRPTEGKHSSPFTLNTRALDTS